MAMIEISKETRDVIIMKIKNYMQEELDYEIEGFDADFLLSFFTQNVGVYYYNQALIDVHALIAKQMESFADSVYDLEKPIPDSR